MKIILRETFENLGRTGDVVDVKGGYARNFLVPKGIAYPKNRLYERLFEAEREDLLRKDALARAQAEEMAGKAAGVEVDFTVKIGERGKMFGAITNADIAAKLVEKGIEIDKRKIALPEPLKTPGEHLVPVKLHGEVGFTVQVTLIPETPPPDELDDEEAAALAASQTEAEGAEATTEEAATEGAEEAEAKPVESAAVPEPPEIVELVELTPVEKEDSEEEKGDSGKKE